MPVMSVTPGILESTVEVTVSRTVKVNTGNYESLDIFAAVKTTVASGVDMEEVGHQLGEMLDSLQNDDLALAKSLTKEPKSQVHELVKILGK